MSASVDVVDLWTIDVGSITEAASLQMRRHLSADEHDRAARFVHPHHRSRFERRRASVRSILARYVGTDPGGIEFVTGRHGRPEVAGSLLSFSVAHSAGISLVAVSEARVVGADVEHLRALEDLEGMIRVACTAGEAEEIVGAPPSERLQRFLSIWTVKEAYLKAVGFGLQIDPREVAVRLDGNPPLISGPPPASEDWTVLFPNELAGHDLVAAVVVAGSQPVELVVRATLPAVAEPSQ